MLLFLRYASPTAAEKHSAVFSTSVYPMHSTHIYIHCALSSISVTQVFPNLLCSFVLSFLGRTDGLSFRFSTVSSPKKKMTHLGSTKFKLWGPSIIPNLKWSDAKSSAVSSNTSGRKHVLVISYFIVIFNSSIEWRPNIQQNITRPSYLTCWTIQHSRRDLNCSSNANTASWKTLGKPCSVI